MNLVSTAERVTSAACALSLLLCPLGLAQTAAKQPAPHAQPRSPGTGVTTQAPAAVQLVRPDGRVSSTDVRIRPGAVVIEPNDSLDRVLSRNHLSSDPATIEAIRRQNPSLDLDQLHSREGQHLYVPKVSGSASRGGDHLLQIQDPNLARVQLRQDRRDITLLQQKTAAHKDVFASPVVAARQQRALKDVNLASQRLDAFTPSMNARDVALLNFQLSRVQRIGDPTIRLPEETTRQYTAERAAALDQSAQPMRSVVTVTARSGVSYEDLRREVKVVVSGAPGARPPRPQRVYALPAAMVERPSDYSDEDLLSLLRSLTFTNLTTPSSERFLFSDLAIWIGPDNAYDQMLKRLRQGQISSHPVSIRESSPSVIEVAFAVP